MNSLARNKRGSERSRRASLLAGALTAAMLMAGGAAAQTDEHMVLVDTIDVGGMGLGAFDISFVDPTIDLYVLSDRTNGSVDFFDASDNTFTGRVSGFSGAVLNPDGTANNSISGPDGVTIVDHTQVWAGNGDSTVKVIDIATFQIINSISTGGQFRVDEMAYDPTDHIIAVANNADTPPFITLIDTNSHAILGKITFDGTNGTPDATNGIEQPQWSPATGRFYVSVPQVGTDPEMGGISAIDPHSMSVVATYPVRDCSPAGLAVGPNSEALIGCSASFGTAPNVLTQSLVINLVSGNVAANITQVGGSDEVWYDQGTQHYYLGARSNTDNAGTVVPVLGTIDAKTKAFDGNVATSTTAHSVAADRVSHHVFVPIGFVPPGSPAGTDVTNPCPNVSRGCVAVYLPSAIDDDDGTKQAQR